MLVVEAKLKEKAEQFELLNEAVLNAIQIEALTLKDLLQ
jgi:hypothetical protein